LPFCFVRVGLPGGGAVSVAGISIGELGKGRWLIVRLLRNKSFSLTRGGLVGKSGWTNSWLEKISKDRKKIVGLVEGDQKKSKSDGGKGRMRDCIRQKRSNIFHVKNATSLEEENDRVGEEDGNPTR